MWPKSLPHGSRLDDDLAGTPGEQIKVVRSQLDLLDGLRFLHPLDPEAEWAYVTLCDREHELLGALSRKDVNERARRGDRPHSS